MRRSAAVLMVVCVAVLASGCSNFWANYYAIQPGITNSQQVEKMLGKPFVKGEGKWVIEPPKTKEGKEMQFVEVYFDEKGVVVGAKRTNPKMEPPPSLSDGELTKEEIMGTIPPMPAGKQTTDIQTK
jgi:hypothetical protein